MRLILLIATALMLHLLLTGHSRPPEDWRILLIVLAIVQAGGALFLAARNAGRGRLLPLACLLVLPAGLLAPRSGMVSAVLVSHTTLYAGLTLLFGHSLRAGREPLVSRLARQVEPHPTPDMLVYTRQVTWLWAAYGPVQIAVSMGLLALAPLHVWSLFVNVLDLPLLASVFVAEYAVRRWRLGASSAATLRDTLRVARTGLRPQAEIP